MITRAVGRISILLGLAHDRVVWMNPPSRLTLKHSNRNKFKFANVAPLSGARVLHRPGNRLLYMYTHTHTPLSVSDRFIFLKNYIFLKE